MDKNKAMIDYLVTCPTIQSSPLFFNFGNVEDNANQLSTSSNDKSMQKPYIDGSVLKRYTYNIDSFKSVAYNPVISGLSDENVSDLAEVQDVIDWIDAQEELQNYPNFGTDCVIDSMKVLTETPELIGLNTSLNPPTAIYRISIQIDYIDNTKKLWN